MIRFPSIVLGGIFYIVFTHVHGYPAWHPVCKPGWCAVLSSAIEAEFISIEYTFGCTFNSSISKCCLADGLAEKVDLEVGSGV